MSSFVGVLNLNGAPCAPAIIETMLERLSHRVTPDGARRASVRCAGPVGLGCAVLPTTPQARLELENPNEQQVLREGALEAWIASDARLDNRAEVIGALGAGREAREWSDGRLILAAYARWGKYSPQRLRGDFAGAVWDAMRQRLFCLRDRFGVKPFYYAHIPGEIFAFASEIKALWCVPGLDRSVNPTHIADYLTSDFRDKTSTFYLNAHRLSPASWLSFAPGDTAPVREQLYWELDGETELVLTGNARERDEKYAELVRATFGESLRQRMRCDGKLAAFLSGGLDSSCVAALAESEIESERKPLTTLSVTFDRFPQCDERQYIAQTLARGDFAPLWLNGDDISPLQSLEEIVWHMDGPSSGPNICATWARYKALQSANVSVALDGHGGDEIVSHGYVRVVELLRERQFATAWHELYLLRRHGVVEETPASQIWWAMLWHGRDKRGLGRVTRFLARQSARRTTKSDALSLSKETKLSIVSAQCRELINARTPLPPSGVRDHHTREITGPLQPLGLESMDAIAGAYAIETRCPFWEQQLAQLCVSLPADQKLRRGYNRYVMRRAMQGLLSPSVQWRPDKTDFSPQVINFVRERENARLEAFFAQWESATSELENYLDLENVRAQWEALQSTPPGSPEAATPAFALWKAFNLGVWLAIQ